MFSKPLKTNKWIKERLKFCFEYRHWFRLGLRWEARHLIRELRRRQSNKPREWIDDYGNAVHVGDTLLFMTLYGYRQAVVQEIICDLSHPWEAMGSRVKDPVIFRIKPLRIKGFETVFSPITWIQSESTYNPSLWTGKKPGRCEATLFIRRFNREWKKALKVPWRLFPAA